DPAAWKYLQCSGAYNASMCCPNGATLCALILLRAQFMRRFARKDVRVRRRVRRAHRQARIEAILLPLRLDAI
ncbi:MAG: hypothetical protein WBO93_03900, partial [Gammaproteobacteria bacterium]